MPDRPCKTRLAPAMVEVMRKRIGDTGDRFTVWTVQYEQVFESKIGEGFYLNLTARRQIARTRNQFDTLFAALGLNPLQRNAY